MKDSQDKRYDIVPPVNEINGVIYTLFYANPGYTREWYIQELVKRLDPYWQELVTLRATLLPQKRTREE